MRNAVGLTAAIVLALSLGLAAAQGPVAAGEPVCEATAANPVAICFPAQPLTLDHCGVPGPTLRPEFTVSLWHAPDAPSVSYRYSYELVVDGQGQGIRAFNEGDPDSFPYTTSPDFTGLEHIHDYQGPKQYSLRVTINPERGPRFKATSAPVVITDTVRVRGLAVGVSTYRNSQYNLNFPDADAETFHRVITTMLASADTEIDLHTTSKGNSLNPNELLAAITTVANRLGPGTTPPPANESVVCGRDDWFVFYYSGHGVVGVTDASTSTPVGRYISTASFDPTNLAATAVKVTELATRLADTRARNLLVVLDSCFSGNYVMTTSAGGPTSRTGRSADPTPGARSMKVLFVSGGRVVPYGIPAQGDSDAFPQKLVALEKDQRRGFVLAAGGVNQVAEEGPVRYIADQLDFERATVAANIGRLGHGLFTFAWLANLLSQVPAAMGADKLLPGGRSPSGAVDCTLDFGGAATDAITDISRFARKHQLVLQTPEAHSTITRPDPLRCAPEERQ